MRRSLPVICLMGPTAAGKTALAVDIAQTFDAEIISVDSTLVYRQMDIGTAKPTALEQGGVPHYLLDILDPCNLMPLTKNIETGVCSFRSVFKKISCKLWDLDILPSLYLLLLFCSYKIPI